MSIFKKLLVPVDGSAPSDAAVELALRVARDQKADVVFAHVLEVAKIIAMTAVPAAGVDPSYALTAEREAGEDAVRKAVDAAGRVAVRAESLLEEGGCVDTLLDMAGRTSADLIVIGSHGRGGIARALLGSVAEGVLRRADVPVLVTRARHG